MQEINEPLSLVNEIVLSENSTSTTEFSLNKELDDNEKINLLINQLTLLSHKYGLGEVEFWYEPFSDNYKNFSIQISPDKSADELIDILYKIEDEMRDFSIKRIWKTFLIIPAYHMILMLNNFNKPFIQFYRKIVILG